MSVTFAYCVETAKDMAIVAGEFELLNCTIFNDFELPLNYISRFQRQTQSRGLSATAELFVCPMLRMNIAFCHGQNITLPVCVCVSVCVRHTFYQLAYRSDPSTDFYS